MEEGGVLESPRRGLGLARLMAQGAIVPIVVLAVAAGGGFWRCRWRMPFVVAVARLGCWLGRGWTLGVAAGW